jgi:hypothetical protein
MAYRKGEIILVPFLTMTPPFCDDLLTSRDDAIFGRITSQQQLGRCPVVGVVPVE